MWAGINNIDESVSVCNLILPVPDTDFRGFLEEVDEFVKFAPEIITAIEGDMDDYAKRKKSLRLADRSSMKAGLMSCPE